MTYLLTCMPIRMIYLRLITSRPKEENMFGFRHAMREGHHGCGLGGHHASPRGGRSGRGEGGRGWSEDDQGFGRGGGRRRMFDGGELRLVLLKLIADKPR